MRKLTRSEKEVENIYVFDEIRNLLTNEGDNHEVVFVTTKLKKLTNRLYPTNKLRNVHDSIFDKFHMSYIFKKFVENKLFDLSDIVFEKGIELNDLSIKSLYELALEGSDLEIVNYLLDKGYKYDKDIYFVPSNLL